MSEEMENQNEIDAVVILPDVMDKICSYLSRKDLCVLAEVCKSWYDAAVREKTRRCYIQQMRLFYKFGNLDTMLKVEPYASLLIYDSKLETSLPSDFNILRLKKKVLKHFQMKQPRKTIVLRVKNYLIATEMDNAPVRNDENPPQVTQNINCGILGLFFPSVSKRLRVRVAWKPSAKAIDYADFVAACLFEKLEMENSKYPKSALLLFVESNDPGAALVAHHLRERMNTDYNKVWTGEVSGEIVGVNSRTTDHRKNKKKAIVAMSIAGPTIESWGERIYMRLPRSQMERKLHELKDRVKLKKHCIALLSAPCKSPCGKSRGIMRLVRRIFPEIPFVGLFDNHKKSIRGPEEWEKCYMLPFYVDDYAFMSIIIITYN